MKQISLFNHKGGVSKTTTSFHLGWMLAEFGKRVMIVDCDPQCNLTSILLGEYDGEEYPFESYSPREPRNIKDAVMPAFESRPYSIAPVELQNIPDQDNLFLLPGHVTLAEYESQLAVSHELSNTLSALQNVPGALREAIRVTGNKNNIDIAIVDMSPSLGALNQNLFMTSDGFIIPMGPDLFSVMALRSLSRILPKWSDWSKKAAANSILRSADYPFPERSPKYLGSAVQNFRKRARGNNEAQPTAAFQAWFDKLREVKKHQLIPALSSSNMMLPPAIYERCDANPEGFLLEISAFDSLIAVAQDVARPVFALDVREHLAASGIIADNHRKKIQDIRERYKVGAIKVINLLEEI